MRLVVDRRMDVLEFVTSRIRHPLHFDGVAFEAVGAEDSQGNLRAGCLFYHYKPVLGGHDIEASFATEGVWFTKNDGPQLLRDLFMLAFWRFGCVRVTATVARSHKRARKAAEQLGFRQEGSIKWGLGKDKTAILYGVTYADCPWLDDDDKALIDKRLQEICDGRERAVTT